MSLLPLKMKYVYFICTSLFNFGLSMYMQVYCVSMHIS